MSLIPVLPNSCFETYKFRLRRQEGERDRQTDRQIEREREILLLKKTRKKTINHKTIKMEISPIHYHFKTCSPTSKFG